MPSKLVAVEFSVCEHISDLQWKDHLPIRSTLVDRVMCINDQDGDEC